MLRRNASRNIDEVILKSRIRVNIDYIPCLDDEEQKIIFPGKLL